MWEPDTLRAGPAGPGRSEDGMSGKKKRGPARAVPRAYGRLTRHERDTVQRMLERRASCREIARELGRSPSTVSAEVASHRFVTAPKPRRGERVDASADLSAACPRLAAWPRCCNGCGRYRAIGCKRRPHVFYGLTVEGVRTQTVDRLRRDADEPAAAARLEAIRDCLRRGLSPEQMAARNGGPVDLSPSTIYRWVAAGYDGMTNMELRRKVGYRPRKRAAGRAATRHSARRSYAAFLALGEDACAAAWEMDTVEGAREDSACLLTLLHRPSRLQLALPLEEKTAGCVADALAILGADGTRRVFRAVLTDNGAEFSDEAAIAALIGEGPGETRLFYCDPRRSDQKGACERNHVEIRKLLPKGAGIRFDRLAPADLALAMSHVNSEPRGALGFSTPARAFRAMLGEDAAALLDAYGVGDVALGDLDLTPGLIERARAERGDAPLA